MKNKFLKRGIIFGIVVIFIGVSVAPSISGDLADDIEDAIVLGIDWLAGQQNVDGSWGTSNYVATTGFVLIKLQDRAYELNDPDIEDPFDPDYEYSEEVIDGWEYLFTAAAGPNDGTYAIKQAIDNQDHTLGASGTVDNPDTNGNGYGIYFDIFSPVYSTGICLMALAASGTPNRPNDGGIDYDGDLSPDTFKEIAQDAVDWLAFAQADSGIYEGGYYYTALDNSAISADNSNSGYAYLGLAAAEGFSCTIPGWVKTELNAWITAIQDPVNLDPDDGGSWYVPVHSSWVNELKTGNLIFEMTFYGDIPSVQRFKDAIDYIERHWNDANLDPGFRGDLGIDDDIDGSTDEDPYNGIDDDIDGSTDEDMGLPHHYQAIYCLMKGLEYSGIDLLDLDGDLVPEHDWFSEIATMLLAQQNPGGSWPSSTCYVWPDGTPGRMSGEILSTVWVLLTLERIAPPPPYTVTKDFRYTAVDFDKWHWECITLPDGTEDCWVVDDPDDLGYLLPQDIDGNYLVELVVHKNGKVKSTNPGQLYGVITITGPVSEVFIEDNFDHEFDINPGHLGGGIEILVVDPDGYATILTDEPGIWASVCNDEPYNDALISIDLETAWGGILEPGYKLMIFVKFQTAMKHEYFPALPYYDFDFWNAPDIWINNMEPYVDDPIQVTANIELSIK